MAAQIPEEEVYEVAKKRVKAKRDFYGNLGAWVIVNCMSPAKVRQMSL